LDETGVVKKGDRSVDRDLYLPASWTQDPARCRTADIPEEVAFQTKPQLGQAMVARALAAGVPFGWVTGDRRLRVWLEEHAIRHVMAVKCTEPVWTLTDGGPTQVAAQDLIAEVEPAQWLRINAGDGSKGKRFYDWTRVPLWRWGLARQGGVLAAGPPQPQRPWGAGLLCLLRPGRTSLVTLGRVAGCRWRVEEAFEQAKAKSGSITTRSASIWPGSGTSPWPWRRWRSWP
jgi:SRSO17 transposase